ncbi:MAG: manganese efflux pump [Firmicutes bacterium]|nr:manganese efflux pump [Bacillota bacterium]
MLFISAFLFAISTNLDSLIVGLSYGFKKISISFHKNMIISIIALIGTGISIYLGKAIIYFIPDNLPKILGALILIIIGLYPIIKPLIYKVKNANIYSNPEKYDEDKSGFLDTKESIFLGLALTANNFAFGIGIGLVGMNALIILILTFGFSLGFLHIGQLAGKKYSLKRLEKYAGIISGVIIILLGIYEIIA